MMKKLCSMYAVMLMAVTLSVQAAGPAGMVERLFVQKGSGAVPRAMAEKLAESASANDFGAKGNNAADDTAAVQRAINAGNVKFVTGQTYRIDGDLQIPSNRTMWVEKGATINTKGRFTAYNVDNVEWKIDGRINVLEQKTAPSKAGWPNTAAGTQAGDERGFLEFGGSDLTKASVGGFWVHGTGRIVGPWAGGVPNFSNSAYQVNRKGIAIWNAKNVRVEGIEISHFDGEQVYAFINQPDMADVIFTKIYSHNARFNALNFNVSTRGYQQTSILGAYRGLKIIDNTVENAYAGVEASAGVIQGNYVRNTTNYGIWFGLGTGRGPIEVASNVVEDCAQQSYVMSYDSSMEMPVYDIAIHDNKAINSGTDAFLFNRLVGFTVKNNMTRGHGRLGAGKAYGFTNSKQGWVDGNITFDPGPYASGNLTSVTSILNLGSNPVVLPGGTEATANGNGFGVGGKFASAATYGNRENQFAVWSSDFGAVGAGPEFVFKNGSAGSTVFAAVTGKGGSYDANGSTGGVVVATKKTSTAQATPAATAEFNAAGNTILSGTLTTGDTMIIRTSTPMTNGAAAATGTLTNAPFPGNPTKWLPVMDNGTVRYVPAW